MTYHDGIDTSRWSGLIRWQEVHDSGMIDFVINKATQGTTGKDQQFDNNKAGCNEVGIPNGAYHFFEPSPNIPPDEQAEWFVNVCGDNIDIYVVDVETVVFNLASEILVTNIAGDNIETPFLPGKSEYSDEEMIAIQRVMDNLNSEAIASGSDILVTTLAERVKIFLETLYSLTGKMGLIYTSKGFWDSNVANDWIWDMPYDLWVAHWTNLPNPLIPRSWDNWVIWQYTDSLRIPGIDSYEDGDRIRDNINLYEFFGNGEIPPVTTVTIKINNSYRRAITIYVKPNLSSASLGLAFASSIWIAEPKIMGEDNREYYKLGYSGYVPATLCTKIDV